jgi:hypothetical protein
LWRGYLARSLLKATDLAGMRRSWPHRLPLINRAADKGRAAG